MQNLQLRGSSLTGTRSGGISPAGEQLSKMPWAAGNPSQPPCGLLCRIVKDTGTISARPGSETSARPSGAHAPVLPPRTRGSPGRGPGPRWRARGSAEERQTEPEGGQTSEPCCGSPDAPSLLGGAAGCGAGPRAPAVATRRREGLCTGAVSFLCPSFYTHIKNVRIKSPTLGQQRRNEIFLYWFYRF